MADLTKKKNSLKWVAKTALVFFLFYEFTAPTQLAAAKMVDLKKVNVPEILVTTAEDEPVIIALDSEAGLSNIVQPFTYDLLMLPHNGLVAPFSKDEPNKLIYTPERDFYGTDSFSYKVPAGKLAGQ